MTNPSEIPVEFVRECEKIFNSMSAHGRSTERHPYFKGRSTLVYRRLLAKDPHYNNREYLKKWRSLCSQQKYRQDSLSCFSTRLSSIIHHLIFKSIPSPSTESASITERKKLRSALGSISSYCEKISNRSANNPIFWRQLLNSGAKSTEFDAIINRVSELIENIDNLSKFPAEPSWDLLTSSVLQEDEKRNAAIQLSIMCSSLTTQHFKKPYDPFVAELINTILGEDIVSAQNVKDNRIRFQRKIQALSNASPTKVDSPH